MKRREMDEPKVEIEFDEFDKLLRELPNAASGQKSQHYHPQSPPNMLLLDHKGMNLPDEHSLRSALADLSLNDQYMKPMEEVQPTSTLFDLQCPSNFLKEPVLNISTQLMVLPSFQSQPVNVPCAFNNYHVPKVASNTSNVLTFIGVQQLGARANGCWQQQRENALQLAHSMNGFEVFSNAPTPSPTISATPCPAQQQQMFLDNRTPPHYSHLHRMDHPPISWPSIEEEQYHGIHHQQCMFLQQPQKIHPTQEINGKTLPGLMHCNQRYSYFGAPFLDHPERSNQEALLNSYVNLRGPSHSYSSFSPTVYNSMQVSNKIEAPSFPEKILTRSQGLDMIRAVKFSSVEKDQQQTHVSPNGKVSSSNVWHHLSTPHSGCFQLHCFSSRGSSPSEKESITDFKSVPQRYTLLDEVTGRIYLMAKDQHGCRFLQKKFTEGAPKDVEKIFLEIIDHTVELMTDPFGNYLIQKLLEVCDDDKRTKMLHSITSKSGELVRISCDMHGTRAVQKVIETLKTPEHFSMVVSALSHGVVTLMKNMNGNHVAQRCLQYLMPEYNEFLFEAAANNCIELATDRHGCCVLQRCLSHSDEKQRQNLVCEITTNSLILSQDPFGNYVVQYVFELELPWATRDILDQLRGNYADLSVQKHSSNVVEKCLKYADEEHCTCIIQELTENPRFEQIMQDPYGNYVIQAAVNDSKGALNLSLMDAIIPHIPVLRTSPYGKKVLSCICLKK